MPLTCTQLFARALGSGAAEGAEMVSEGAAAGAAAAGAAAGAVVAGAGVVVWPMAGLAKRSVKARVGKRLRDTFAIVKFWSLFIRRIGVRIVGSPALWAAFQWVSDTTLL
jgi:hypothetical protein